MTTRHHSTSDHSASDRATRDRAGLGRARPHTLSARALLDRCRVLVVLFVATVAVAACLPAPSPWIPTSEDTGPDSGPDPGTCEARRDCGPVVK